jgi:hypothetical protein
LKILQTIELSQVDPQHLLPPCPFANVGFVGKPLEEVKSL